jgi:hypothetical protein
MHRLRRSPTYLETRRSSEPLSTGIHPDLKIENERASTSPIGGKRGGQDTADECSLPPQATMYEPFVPTAAFASDCLLLALESSYSFQKHE